MRDAQAARRPCRYWPPEPFSLGIRIFLSAVDHCIYRCGQTEMLCSLLALLTLLSYLSCTLPLKERKPCCSRWKLSWCDCAPLIGTLLPSGSLNKEASLLYAILFL